MDRLSEIRARCEAARPVVFVDVPIRAETRVFLEHAKSDMTYLLAEVERLNQQLNSAKIGWDTYKRYSAELADRAEKAEAENRWIPVSEKPPGNGYALAYCSSGNRTSTFFWNGKSKDLEELGYVVTHWRPLPEPPKGE